MSQDLLLEAASKLRDQPLLRRVHGTALVSGDIHGDLEALELLIKKREELGAKNLILLGDYVNRGEKQVEVMEKIAELILNDNHFTALRGNHEDFNICRRYGYLNHLRTAGHAIEPSIEIFKNLPLVAISNEIYMAHGGIPTDEAFKPDDIVRQHDIYPREEVLLDGNQVEICWNDPIEDSSFDKTKMRGSRRGPGVFEWGMELTKSFLSRNNLSLIMRAHIALPDGARWFHNKQILSLFTSQGGPYISMKRKFAELDLDAPESIVIHDISKQG